MRFHRILTLVVAGIVLWLPAGAACGQSLNMDMSWAIQSQMNNWNQGMQAAQQAGQAWYQACQDYRAQTGYTGVIPGPVSQESLQTSIGGMGRAFDDYNHAWHGWSNRTSTAIDNYANHAILGQGGWVNPATGQSYTLSNQSNSWWTDPAGTTLGTNTYAPPYYNGGWTPLQPVW